MLVFNKKNEKHSFEEFEPHIIEVCSSPNIMRKQASIHTGKKSNNSAENINDKIIAGLPIIPAYKQFRDPVTIEQEALADCIQNKSINKEKVKIIEDSFDFYKQCFGELEKIDLTELTEGQLAILTPYLNHVFNCFPTIWNEVEVNLVYRATIVEDDFLENGKVRQLKFLTFPPVEIIKKRGKYNRASGPDKTVFYCSTMEQVAIRELRPGKGQRIIVSTWKNNSGKQLVRFPIVLTAGIPNELADRSNYAFEYICKDLDPILTQWMSYFFSFLAKEFIKETKYPDPKRLDYLFSSFFADRILQPLPAGSKTPNFDCIVYPSVAWSHIPDNLAIVPDFVSKYFVPVRTVEFEVIDTLYNKNINLPQYPVNLRFIRESKYALKNGMITLERRFAFSSQESIKYFLKLLLIVMPCF